MEKSRFLDVGVSTGLLLSYLRRQDIKLYSRSNQVTQYVEINSLMRTITVSFGVNSEIIVKCNWDKLDYQNSGE